MDEAQVAYERECTPGTKSVIHFNNAGSSLPTTQVVEAAKDYLDLEATIGGYEAVSKRFNDLKERPYIALASLLNCHPSEIAVVTSCTTAWQQVIYGVAWTWKPGDRLLTSVSEYGSNYIAYLQLAQRTGITIEVIPETVEGDIDLDALEAAITNSSGLDNDTMSGSSKSNNSKPVVLITITHVPTSSGRVYNAAGVGVIAKKYGILYMLDACQSVGQMPIDVQVIGCDFLAGTGRKYLRAPRGSGFLYCSKAAMNLFEPAAIDNTGAFWASSKSYNLDPTARRFEVYEMSMSARLGLALAVEHLLKLGPEAVWQRIQYLATTLRKKLHALPGVVVKDHGKTLCGIVSFIIEDKPADFIQQSLLEQGINTSWSWIGSTRLDFEQRGLTEVVRVSVHYYNTEDEIESLITALKEL